MNKTPLILIPGLLCDAALWAYQVDALATVADCTVVDAHMQLDTIETIAEAVIADAPSRFALAGLSMGGYVALEICRKFPERVDRLALIDTSARADTIEQTTRRENLIAMCREGKFPEVMELLSSLLVHPDRQVDTVLNQKIADMARRLGPDVFIRQQHAIMGRLNQVPHLSRISCPTIVVCGEQDQITPPECAEEMASHIQGAELAILANCGHMSTMEKPDEVSGIMRDWLMFGS